METLNSAGTVNCASYGLDGGNDSWNFQHCSATTNAESLDEAQALSSLLSSKTFPNAGQLAASDVFNNFRPLLPAPLLPIPRTKLGRGHRHRQRTQFRREIKIEANTLLRQLNAMDCGLRNSRTSSRQSGLPSVECGIGALSPAVRRLHSLAQAMAATAVQERRACSCDKLPGAQVTASLIRADVKERYTFVTRSHNQVPLDPWSIDDPPPGWPTVGMLHSLPADERAFYEKEENVADYCHKSKIIVDQLETRYAFIGGTYDNYITYLNRDDVDPTLWHYELASDVHATAGVAAVAKKSGMQRKLITACSSNCMFAEATGRSSLGMAGSSALAQTFVPGGSCSAASFDESNAFTAVVTPTWMWRWFAAPPVRAGDVWTRLPSSLRAKCSVASWVSPCYTRLAMGASHSVHVLMAVNIETIGRALWRSRNSAPFERMMEERASLRNRTSTGTFASSSRRTTIGDGSWHTHAKSTDCQRCASHDQVAAPTLWTSGSMQ